MISEQKSMNIYFLYLIVIIVWSDCFFIFAKFAGFNFHTFEWMNYASFLDSIHAPFNFSFYYIVGMHLMTTIALYKFCDKKIRTMKQLHTENIFQNIQYAWWILWHFVYAALVWKSLFFNRVLCLLAICVRSPLFSLWWYVDKNIMILMTRCIV